MDQSAQYSIEPFDPTDLGFSVSQDHLDDEAARTERAIARLKSLPASLFQRLHMHTSLTVAFGSPSTRSLPARVRIPVEFHGFEPVTRTLAGTFPMLFHYVPFWVDRTGFAVLCTYGAGNRWYIHTYFDDGTAICTSNRESKNANTEGYLVPDLAEAYPAHMKAVRRKMEAGEARPIARHTPRLIRRGWSIYHLFFVPPYAAVYFVLSGYAILGMMLYFIWVMLERFDFVDEHALASLWAMVRASLGI